MIIIFIQYNVQRNIYYLFIETNYEQINNRIVFLFQISESDKFCSFKWQIIISILLEKDNVSIVQPIETSNNMRINIGNLIFKIIII